MTPSCLIPVTLAGVLLLLLPHGQAATTTTHRPHRHGMRTVCYLSGWARHRQDPVQYHPEDLDTSLCTHVIFAFALLDNTGLNLVPAEDTDPQMYVRLTNLKREKPSLKIMISVGGWNMGSAQFTKTVTDTASMYSFSRNAVEFLHKYNFDGLDVDWEYPASRGSPPHDKQHFTHFLQLLRQDFLVDHQVTGRPKLLLSVAINPSPNQIQTSYELTEIAKQVDFINAMTYDIHGSWEDTVGHHSTLYSPTQDETDSIDYMITWILNQDNSSVPPLKINLGLPFYGKSFNLTDPHQTGLGAPISGDGSGGSLLHAKGVMAYYEVCKLLTEHNDTITDMGRVPGTKAPYIVDGHRWIGYDDEMSIREKVDYAYQTGLGGVFIWAIDMDDFHGICGQGHYPLMQIIRNQLHQSIVG